MLKCPTCGDKLEMVRRPMIKRDQDILRAIEQLSRDLGSAPRAPQIALKLERPLSSVKLDLRTLESGGHIHRPYGPKCGWSVRNEDEIVLVSARRLAVA